MPSYSIAAGQKRLPDLVDRALAGEEVILTREGQPAVELRAVPPSATEAQRGRNAKGLRLLRKHRESMPAMTTPYLELKRMEEEERGY